MQLLDGPVRNATGRLLKIWRALKKLYAVWSECLSLLISSMRWCRSLQLRRGQPCKIDSPQKGQRRGPRRGRQRISPME